MEISKKSWHYRLHMFYSNTRHVPKTLCGYFWKTVGFCAFILAKTSVLFAAAFLIGSPPVEAIFAALSLTAPSVVLIPLYIIAGVATIAIIISVFFAIMYLLAKGVEKTQDFIHDRSIKAKPTLIGEFIKAKKSKYCPLITIKED